jgi:hypothetical protein
MAIFFHRLFSHVTSPFMPCATPSTNIERENDTAYGMLYEDALSLKPTDGKHQSSSSSLAFTLFPHPLKLSLQCLSDSLHHLPLFNLHVFPIVGTLLLPLSSALFLQDSLNKGQFPHYSTFSLLVLVTTPTSRSPFFLHRPAPGTGTS